MKEAEFKAWLAASGAASENARNVRAYAVRTIEKNLARLGLPHGDLDEAWAADRLEATIARLKGLRAEARAGGEGYRHLMPNSDNPPGRLSSWISWVRQYGRFLAGEPPRAARDADRIRQYVLETYIEAAREAGHATVEVVVRDVNAALGLDEAWPNICQALRGRTFLEQAEVPPPEQIGADQSSATRFHFDLGGRQMSRPALEAMKRRFLELCPDFQSFRAPGAIWAGREKAYKVAAAERVREALAGDPEDVTLGRKVFEVLKTASKDGPLVRWQTEDAVVKTGLGDEFHAILGRLLRAATPTTEALAEAERALAELRNRGAKDLTWGERVNILTATLAMVRPDSMAPFKVSRINDAWQRLTGTRLFVEKGAGIAADYARLAEGFAEIEAVMRDSWRWEPQDWLDLQGFLWIATDDSSAPPGPDPIPELSMPQPPVNLILYGPPGTGKTFATAAEAVRLCGEAVPEDRAALMAVYRRLVDEGRIAFVTFHQSMSYEEFIEGLRPATGAEEEAMPDSPPAAGFHLRVEDGIFKRLALKAMADRDPRHEGAALDRSRRVIRIGLTGANWSEKLNRAIREGRVEWPHGGAHDWSPLEFESWDAIKDLRKRDEPELLGNHPKIYGTWVFRNIEVGEYVALTAGHNRIVAFGELAGDYGYDPSARDEMQRHCRKVRWLWQDPEGIPREAVYPTPFTTFHTAYPLNPERIDWGGLEHVVFGEEVADRPAAVRRPYVLIIDEINRANMSKVFGELITLIEPDKRLGMDNGLRLVLPYSKTAFGVPANLHIIGTMNTADRSIALLDTALRRRFTFRELMPDPEQLPADVEGIDLQRLLARINARIEYLFDREHQIGHAYFIGCTCRTDVDAVMRHKVIPLLAEYFFEDWARIAAVLGDLTPYDGPIRGGFLVRALLPPPPGFEDDAAPRWHWRIRSEAEGFDYAQLAAP